MDDRFTKELEFAQSLCNPGYIQWLYEEGYFSDIRFLQFLKYLKYWQLPPYSNHLIYPQTINILELLNDPEFVSKLGDEQTYITLGDQQLQLHNIKE